MSSDVFIGLLCEEYKIHINCAKNGTYNGMNGNTNLANTQKAPGAKQSLEAFMKIPSVLIVITARKWDNRQASAINYQGINVIIVENSFIMQKIAGGRKELRTHQENDKLLTVLICLKLHLVPYIGLRMPLMV